MKIRLLNFSEAMALGLHAIIYMSTRDRNVSAKEVAQHLEVSPTHMSKVLRKLVVGNIISSAKGPGGGFYITDEQRRTTLDKILYAIDGDISFSYCLFPTPRCKNEQCLLGDCVHNFGASLRAVFETTKISDIPKLVGESCLRET